MRRAMILLIALISTAVFTSCASNAQRDINEGKRSQLDKKHEFWREVSGVGFR
jgi:outer membrane biogenesis lipoprotein LolB